MIAPKSQVTRSYVGKSDTSIDMVPNLIELQTRSYESFLQVAKLKNNEPIEKIGLEEVFNEIFPIESPKGNLVLNYQSYHLEFEKVKYSAEVCVTKGLTYAVPLKVSVNLFSRDTGEIRDQDIYLGDIPLMTERGTFIINGAERVVVSQIHRSPGVIFEWGAGRRSRDVLSARIIPYRGSWIEFEVDNRKRCIWVRIDKCQRVLITVFLRVLGYDTREKILNAFYPDTEKGVITQETKEAFVDKILAKPIIKKGDNGSETLIKRAGEKLLLADLDDCLNNNIDTIYLIKDMDAKKEKSMLLFNSFEQEEVLFQKEGEFDLSIDVVCQVLNNAIKFNDRFSAERLYAEITSMFFDHKRYDLGRVGRFKLNKKFNYKHDIKETTLLPEDVINTIQLLIKLFEGEEIVDDIDHLGNRRVRAVGELIALELKKAMVRVARGAREKLALKERRNDIRLQDLLLPKPIIGVIRDFFGSSQLCQFMDQVNPLAVLTHKRRLNALGPGGLSRERAGFDVRDVHYSHYGRVCPIESPEGPNIGLIMSLSTCAKVNQFGFLETPYRQVKDGKVTNKVVYLTAMEEDNYTIAQSDVLIQEDGSFVDNIVAVRRKGDYFNIPVDKVQFMDCTPKQIVSISTSLIPFLEHDDANRALMGSNMQRQAVPLLKPEAPRVGTGMEMKAAFDSGVLVIAQRDGIVSYVSNSMIKISPNNNDDDVDTYPLIKNKRTNQDTCFNQSPLVKQGQKIKKGEVIADGPATSNGELALGRNVLVGFLPWNGYNFEDAILVSERLIQEDVFTSIHIKEFSVEVHDTRQGIESITRDIPNVSERILKKLDENGIVRVGAKVQSNDILVGKITPKSDYEIEPERRLITHVFGEKGKVVRDTSLRLPHGVEGTVVDIYHLRRENGDQLSPGVEEVVRVVVAAKRKLKEGDKMAGRHGNKGVIARVIPQEDMPFMADGTPLDICLSPLGVPSRMNIGQLLETELGLAATVLDKWFTTPVFQSAPLTTVKKLLRDAGFSESSKVDLYDGITGKKFKNPVMVGYMYMLKLHHLVDEKMHARCTGSYSLVTQQPLGGKAQFGGQRLGEMEVWALEAYGAAHTLNEFITIKSDDLQGRLKIYEAIVKGKNYSDFNIPESFRVLMHEMRGLCLNMSIFDRRGRQLALTERDEEIIKKLEGTF